MDKSSGSRFRGLRLRHVAVAYLVLIGLVQAGVVISWRMSPEVVRHGEGRTGYVIRGTGRAVDFVPVLGWLSSLKGRRHVRIDEFHGRPRVYECDSRYEGEQLLAVYMK